MLAIQVLSLIVFNLFCTIIIHTTQLVGIPLSVIGDGYYRRWLSMTKRLCGLWLTALLQLFTPAKLVVSADSSVQTLYQTSTDGLETTFEDRIIMMSNHRSSTDFLYLWWLAYTSKMHGHVYFILKDSLKYIPIAGPAMRLWGFLFMARKWIIDQDRVKSSSRRFRSGTIDATSGQIKLEPTWLFVYPEGTRFSSKTKESSTRWARALGIKDLQHQLFPRKTGLYSILENLDGTIDYVYDVTIAYGDPSPDIEKASNTGTRSLRRFILHSDRVSMHIRRFHKSVIPLHDAEAFGDWLLQVWREKDELLQHWKLHGRFTSDAAHSTEIPIKVGVDYKIGSFGLLLALILCIVAPKIATSVLIYVVLGATMSVALSSIISVVV